MTLDKDDRCAWGTAALAAALMGLGIVMFIALATGGGAGLLVLILLGGPAVFAIGVVLLGRALLPRIALLQEAPVLCVGLVMVLVGGLPWIYTPWLLGDRPGGEAAGMFGTIIFLFTGVPGVLLVIVAGLARLVRWSSG